MNNKLICIRLKIIFALLVAIQAQGQTGDTLLLRGQASTYMNLNTGNELPLWLGARYLPQANYLIRLPNNRLIDFEASININGGMGVHPFDSVSTNGNIRPYRVWARFSGKQFEARAGLQKINFGSASMLRPLMWFDQLDPRDPLQMTDGVWALLGRYYFMNNANIWLWLLYGNEGPKTWEIGKTSKPVPEFGSRIQLPVPGGEAAFSYHHRTVDLRNSGLEGFNHSAIPEHRVAIDGKWDVGAGLWFESVWIHKTMNTGIYTNQEILSTGLDYTFGVGNGLNATLEHLWFALDEKAFSLAKINSFTGLSLSYPTGMNSHLSVIVYRDWKNSAQYNFINFRKQFNRFSMYLMAFINPTEYRMPQQSEAGSLFSGKGLQVMIVYNH